LNIRWGDSAFAGPDSLLGPAQVKEFNAMNIKYKMLGKIDHMPTWKTLPGSLPNSIVPLDMPANHCNLGNSNESWQSFVMNHFVN